MGEHFIDYINIKHYKCFDDFSAEGFKRVNLIAGKNNVGKTALMEALFATAGAETIPDIIHKLKLVNSRRYQIDQSGEVMDVFDGIENDSYGVEFETNHNSVAYRFDTADIPGQYRISLNSNTADMTKSSVKEVSNEAGLIPFKAAYISSIRDSQEEIIYSFTSIQKKDREPDLNKIIHSFDNSIENIKVIGGNSIQCKVVSADGNSVYRNLNEFGDGLRHYISIIADLFASENTCLFVDEVDNGIHYSSLGNLWEIILILSKELNVQVFATTHSKECIEAYCRAVEKLEDKDITFTTLVKNKEKEVKAIVRDYELFTDSIHDAHEVRGW